MSSNDAQIISIDDERAARARGGARSAASRVPIEEPPTLTPSEPEARSRAKCAGTTAEGASCRNYAVLDGYCRIHAPNPPEREPLPELTAPEPSTGIDLLEGLRDALGDRWLDHVREVAAFARRRLTGDYEVDEFGFDTDFTEHVLLPLLRPIHRRYWRVESRGAENIASGGGLIVANHAGTLPADAVMTRLDVFEQTGRHVRELGADLVFKLPFVGHLSRKTGATLAHNDDAHRLLTSGELCAVWPEGFKGIGKRYSERYKLQRFGRGGFVASAMRAQVPIIPTAIVGSEEIYPLLFDVKALARVLGLPYFPIVAQMGLLPVLGPLALLPLPSKWIIEYGEPIDTTSYGSDAADDPMAMFDLTDRVRDTIQQMLYSNLMTRRGVFA